MSEKKRSKVIITAYQGEGEVVTYETSAALCVILQDDRNEVMFLGQMTGMDILMGVSNLVEAAVDVLISQGDMAPDEIGEDINKGIQYGILKAINNAKNKGKAKEKEVSTNGNEETDG